MKLTEELRPEIQRRRDEGATLAAIASAYDVSVSTVASFLKKGKVTPPPATTRLLVFQDGDLIFSSDNAHSDDVTFRQGTIRKSGPIEWEDIVSNKRDIVSIGESVASLRNRFTGFSVPLNDRATALIYWES